MKQSIVSRLVPAGALPLQLVKSLASAPGRILRLLAAAIRSEAPFENVLGWKPRSQGGHGMMFSLGVAIALSLGWSGPAEAQTPGLYWQCQPVDSTHSQAGYCPVSTGYPLPVTSTTGTLPAAVISFQSKIAVTGTAVQLPSNVLTQGIICFAKAANAASIEFGPTGVTNVSDGTGNGIIIAAGGGWSTAVGNSNAIFINGTANDIVSCSGN